MRRYAAVLLDVDGTLVDSNDAHAEAWVEVFAAHDISVAIPQVRRLIGMGGDRLVETLAGIPRGSRKNQKLADEHSEVFRERFLRSVQPILGVRALVLRLQREGYQLAIASAAHDKDLRPLLEIADIADLIDARERPDKPDESKPDPDTVEVALRRLDVDRSRVLMIGDTPYDIECANGAAVDALGFSTGGYTREALAGAIAVYAGPSHLLACWETSPLAT